MADGIHHRYLKSLDPDDYRQSCLVHYYGVYTEIDTNAGVFGCITTVFLNLGGHIRRL